MFSMKYVAFEQLL